jgi:hypothetical protein
MVKFHGFGRSSLDFSLDLEWTSLELDWFSSDMDPGLFIRYGFIRVKKGFIGSGLGFFIGLGSVSFHPSLVFQGIGLSSIG